MHNIKTTCIVRLCVAAVFLCRFALADTDVLTHHNEAGRTGANLSETVLTPANINPKSFGYLFCQPVDGQIFAQPLVTAKLDLPDGSIRNVVYVATMRNNVYAFDADRPNTAIWTAQLGLPVSYTDIPHDAAADFGLYFIRPFIGITSTPVIDRAQAKLYLVAKVSAPVRYVLYCLDIRKGTVLGSEVINAKLNGVEVDEFAFLHLQRPALLLSKGKVYIAFGSHQDAGKFGGWLLAYDAASLKQLYAFCTTGTGEQAGVWQSGSGPAADEAGNIYVISGNGKFDPQRRSFGDSFLKLSPDLSLIGWFTPADYNKLEMFDIDLGSSGPLVVPHSQHLIGGGKEGKLYVLDRGELGGLQRRHWFRDQLNPPVQVVQAAPRWKLNWFSWFPPLFNRGYHHIHGSPVYWDSAKLGPQVYLWAEQDRVKAFHYVANRGLETKPRQGMIGPQGMPGGFLSVSAKGRADGVLWANMPLKDDAFYADVQGVLRAFDAETMRLLWSSDLDDPSHNFKFAHFCPPTVANGKVFLATSSEHLFIYGPVSRRDSPGAAPIAKVPGKSRGAKRRRR